MTNGRAGMMRFSRGFMRFAQDLPVVPVALRVRPAIPAVRSHTLDSHFLANLFWFSWQPWHELEATALPAMRLGEGEPKAAFVRRVQRVIAEELRCWLADDVTIQQKRKLAQRAALQRTRRQQRRQLQQLRRHRQGQQGKQQQD